MTPLASVLPGFGQADLSNCEREQIHLAASIQPHGALVVVREPDHVIVQASANVAEFLGLSFDPLGRTLGDLGGDLDTCIEAHLSEPLTRVPKAVRCRAGPTGAKFDGLLHRPAGGGLIIELERAGPSIDLSRHVGRALEAILAAVSLRQLCDETARLFRDLTGYDRVMVYRFDNEGHGEVFAELREPHLEPYLGNRYPASDIPHIARRLYERNRLRLLVDRAYEPVPLVPRESPFTGGDLDMSMCFLRSMSPIHLQYLGNMGVGATLVVSLMVGGRLWGLVACHHYAPRFVGCEVRAACELQAEFIGTRIAALESFLRGQSEIYVRRIEQRMIEAISREGDWRTALFDKSRALLTPLDAGGAALLFEGQIMTSGEVPGTRELREIGIWLDGKPRAPVIATASLGLDVPEFAGIAGVASGVIAAPVSTSPGEYLIWFRPERVRTVTWGGDPFKPVVVGDDPATLSPRRSFAQWHQLVEKTSEPWTPSDLTAARMIGETVTDVVLQFRSLRVLIAQDQLNRIRRQVRASEQPVIVADHAGRILLVNKAFERLSETRPPQQIADLPPLFAAPAQVREHLRELLTQHKPWRGEVLMNGKADASPAGFDAADPTRGDPARLDPTWTDTTPEEGRPFLIRADPVFSSPRRVLGFVFLFTDLTERIKADAARRRFRDGLLGGMGQWSGRLNSKADLMFRNLLSMAVENAQLTALEITDGVDMTRIPELLDSVRNSVDRTAEVLQHLIRHATDTLAEDEPGNGDPDD